MQGCATSLFGLSWYRWWLYVLLCAGLAAFGEGCPSSNKAGAPMQQPDATGGTGATDGSITGTGGSSAPAGTGGSNGGGGTAGGAGSGPSGSGGSGAGGNGGTGVAGSGGGGSDGGVSTTDGGTPPPNSMTPDPIGNANRAPGFIDLSPPMGDPLPQQGDSVSPAPPAGWDWFQIDGTQCRDGSPAGLYVHQGTGTGLVIYLEGGGACSNANYCAFNPSNVNEVLAGDGQVVIGSAIGAGPGRQQPGAYTDASHTGAPAGIFDTSNAANPFKDWSQVYIPYCTGDVHFGAKANGMVPGLDTPQQFVGYLNMKKFISRIVPTFKSRVTQVVLAGASAGGFGAALNFSMVQDSFGDIPVVVVDDSGPPFDDQHMPVCMQKRWREAWGLNAALPPDCTECQQADGGGLLLLANFLLRKHPNSSLVVISSMEDEVIRLFYSVGLQDCANYDTADPVAVVLLQADPGTYFPADQYTGGLNALRDTYGGTGRLGTFFLGGDNITYHQHIFRDRFYDSSVGTESIAKYVSDFLSGTIANVGP